ncbi:hypothetical protein [Nocardioides sp.]|uniref:hypothetical protein n=1 Tax=Nocardioides sp. TaxID=35761 RepID=UPI0027325E15|nr:hypothetical protein [Nocardioides sp.]MDP3894470.1 hypothetical protein [Nocardioides sp.]
MPTKSAELRREGGAALLVLVLLLSGCGLLPGDERPEPLVQGATSTQAVESITSLLKQRARAVRQRRADDFLGTVGGEQEFLVGQRTYIDNLQQLPLSTYRYSVVAASVRDLGAELEATVRLHRQLDGYDEVPVVTRHRMRFQRRDSTTGELMVTAESLVPGQPGALAPWDIGPIVVRPGRGVLAIFDEGSAGHATGVVRAVERSLRPVRDAVPYEWPETVVVYALSDLRVLSSVDELPGGDADRLDGLAFPVRARPGGTRLAAHRFMLHPRMLHRDGLTRDRLIRHELTHVALGELDDQVPTWLSEGLAEYISVMPVAPQDRVISRDALEWARAGVDELPPDDTFNGPHSGANYGLSWWACEHIAATYGEEMLWRLFDAFREAETRDEQESVLRRELGIDSAELARQAARRILSTFG